MKNRFAFTMIELIFVIVIMGILGKYGVEFLAQAYNSFIFSKINSTLQSDSEGAISIIASKLKYRVKESIVARKDTGNQNDYQALADSNYGEDATILEWIGVDMDGFRGDNLPLWSSIIDLNESNKTTLKSPETNSTAVNELIKILSHGGSDINDSALYFVGSNTNIKKWGWDGNALTEQNTSSIHPVNNTFESDEFVSGIAGVDFNGTDIYEYYQLAWTAYAVALKDYNVSGDEKGNLYLYYNYQPWKGEKYSDGNETLLMNDVSTFRFKAIGSVVKIQVCTKSDVMEDYSLCKEKTIF